MYCCFMIIFSCYFFFSSQSPRGTVQQCWKAKIKGLILLEFKLVKYQEVKKFHRTYVFFKLQVEEVEEVEEEKPRGRGARRSKPKKQVEEVYDFEEDDEDDRPSKKSSRKSSKKSSPSRESASKSKSRSSRQSAGGAKTPKREVPKLKIKLGGRSGKRSKNASSDDESGEEKGILLIVYNYLTFKKSTF